MRKRKDFPLRFWLCLIIISLLTVQAVAAGSVPAAVLESAKSVVRIECEFTDAHSTGSGFVIKSDKDATLVTTNNHVTDGNPLSISVWIGSDEKISAKILCSSRQKDLCILELAYPLGLKALQFCDTSAAQGDAVYAVGFPASADYLSDEAAHTAEEATITDGIVSAVRQATISEYGSAVSLLQISSAINSGNSGGPLFNEKGEVIGINTYGILDAQGIFGAIEIDELTEFLQSNSIGIGTEKAVSFPVPVIIGCGAFLLIVIVVILVAGKKRKQKTTKLPEQTLNSFLKDGQKLSPEQAVSLLMPAALQLRDLHNDGKLHLQISPKVIRVGADGTLLDAPTASEADRYISGFAAPEVYSGNGNAASDVYSFCALLKYLTTGAVPQNALTRQEEATAEEQTAFEKLLAKGMAMEPAFRFESVQSMILALSAYNTGEKTALTANAETEKKPVSRREKPARSRKRSPVLAVVLCLLVLILLAGGAYWYTYTNAVQFAEKEKFAEAKKYLLVPEITKLHDAEIQQYIDAGSLLESREYQKADEAFSQILDYRDSGELQKESRYRCAAQLADANNFLDAKEIYQSLAKEAYKDAADKIIETEYRLAVYRLYEQNDYEKAHLDFLSLSLRGYQKEEAEAMLLETDYLWAVDLINKGDLYTAYEKLQGVRGYSDADDLLDMVTNTIYLEGQELYHSGDWSGAASSFNFVDPYLDTGAYLILIRIHTEAQIVDYIPNPKERIAEILPLFGFEDAAELLLLTDNIASEFLLGTWITSNGNYYFTMKDDGGVVYNLPWFDYGDYYYISNGDMINYVDGKEGIAERTLFSFYLDSPDMMEVYCWKDGSTYTLLRS